MIRTGNFINLKRIFLFCIFSLSILTSGFGAKWKQIIGDYGQAVCLVEIKDKNSTRSSGSGFLFSKDGMIITNAHVVRDAYFNDSLEITVSFELSSSPKKEYIAEIKKYSRELDLAVLEIPGVFQKFCRLGSSSDLSLMDDIMIIGHPLGKSIKATPGYIQAFQDIDRIGKMIDLSAAVDPGNSGGPVFDSNGKIIGVVTAKMPGMNFNLALPIDLAKNSLLNENNVRMVNVKTEPEGARVFINGNYKGISPVEIEYYGINLELRVEKDSFMPAENIISKSAAEKGEISVTLKEDLIQICLLKINSSPPNAIILIDNNEVGKTPMEIEVPGNSKIRIRIIKSGYREYYTEIETMHKKLISVDCNLKR